MSWLVAFWLLFLGVVVGFSITTGFLRLVFRFFPRGRHVGSLQVPIQAASEGLHVCGVLGSSGVRKAFPASRAALPRLSACWSPVLPRWAVDSDSRALLLAARTQRQATEVLACDLRLGAPDSACADTRTTY